MASRLPLEQKLEVRPLPELQQKEEERMNETQAAEFWKRRLIEYVDATHQPDTSDGQQYVWNVERALRSGEYDQELYEY